jgi:short-subunit dehydrogenase
MARLAGRVVAITGASAGIGQACAEQLVAEGASVALLARRADRLNTLVADLTSRGGHAIAVPGDVTREDDVRTLVVRAVEAFGRLDVMIANAGFGYHGTLQETPADVMRRLLDVNFMGTFHAARAALDVFVPQKHGHVLAVSSIVGRRGIAGSSAYSATKAAQLGFMEALRADLVGTGIHASIVFPVSTDTEFHDALARDYHLHVQGLGPRQSAAVVARAIVNCVVSPRAEVYPFRKAKLLAVLSVIAPKTNDGFVQRFMRRRKE